MARKPTKTINVTGLKVKDILKYNVEDFRGVSTQNLKQVTSRLVSAMNKRIKRLGQDEIGRLSPTYQAFEERGKYSVKGLTRSSTLQVFQNLKDSFGKATSLTEWREKHQEILNTLKKKFSVNFNGDIETEKKFWTLYRDYAEMDKRVSNLKGTSGDAINIIYKRFILKKNGKPMTPQGFKAAITRAYNNRMKNEKNDPFNTSTGSVFDKKSAFEDNGNF